MVPVLVAPREQSVVPASRVTFIWKPLKQASAYRIEIARTTEFEDVLYTSKPLQRTEFTLRNELPADEETYYWRVLVEDADGTVHGADNIESFVSASDEKAASGVSQPDQDEEIGPLGRMMHGAAAEVAAEMTHARKWIEEEVELGVEHEGVEAGQILGVVVATAVVLAVAIFVLFQYMDITAEAARVEATGRSGYPELRESRLHAVERLTQYGAVEGEAERYRIPIDRAMELMADEQRQDALTSSELDLGAGDP